MDAIGRRRFVGRVAGVAAVTIAGCTGDPDDARVAADVIAGPGGRAVFEPAAVAVDVGDPVTWYFEGAGHNVSARPGDHDRVELPSDADPFASYGAEESPGTLVQRGETYTHTFDVPGTYVYVCIPHAGAGMIGRIRVA